MAQYQAKIRRPDGKIHTINVQKDGVLKKEDALRIVKDQQQMVNEQTGQSYVVAGDILSFEEVAGPGAPIPPTVTLRDENDQPVNVTTAGAKGGLRKVGDQPPQDRAPLGPTPPPNADVPSTKQR